MKQLLAGLAMLLATLGASLPRAAAQAATDEQLTGQVLDQASRQPLGFVSVGVLRHPFGNVADERGRFALTLPARYDLDSVRFSLLGYANRTVAVAALRRLVAAGPVLLRKQGVPLRTVRVQAPGMRRRVVGNEGKKLLQDYAYNSAGNQLGQLIRVQHPAFLQEVSFQITHCSYDTVRFRLNVYEVRHDYPGDNLLPRPVYLRVSGEQALAGRIYVNLRPYKLWLTGDIIVALELVRALPGGTLLLRANWPGGGPSYELEQTPGPLDARNIVPAGMASLKLLKEPQPDNGPWKRIPNAGMGFDATLLEMPD